MSCCGNKRTAFIGSYSTGGAVQRHFFRYVGRTALTVVGPVSGKYYRFVAPGATVESDPRDAASLEKVPQLRKV